MPSNITLRVCDPYGNKLFETAEFLEAGSAPGLHYVLSVGNIGALTACLPPEFNNRLPKDGRVFVDRSVNGRPSQVEGNSCFLIRKWEYTADYTIITALHANDLMRRRFTMYDPSYDDEGTKFTAEYADDAIKFVWYKNATAGIDTNQRAYSTVTADTDNTLADISAYVSQQADTGSAAQITIDKLSYLNMLDVFHLIEDAAYANGSYVCTEIVAPAQNMLELQTFINQRGVDRRFSTGNGLIFSAIRGNLENVYLSIDAIEEKTFAQSLGETNFRGQMSGTYRDDNRIGESPFGRIETMIDANDTPNGVALTYAAQSAVQAGLPITIVSADLTDTDQCLYGIHYGFGDYVTVEAFGGVYDMRLNLVDVTYTANGETKKAGFRAENGIVQL